MSLCLFLCQTVRNHNISMFNGIRKLLSLGARNKSFTASNGHEFVGSRSFGSALSFYKGLSYDNTYPSITKIANEFMTIRPYAIDGNGKTLKKTALVDAIYHPSQQMSSVDFREALAVMTLVHRKTYLLVHHRENGKPVAGGPVTADNIAGFTFLEGVSEVVIGNEKTYKVGSDTYSRADVIEIYAGFDPYDLSRGYSPSIAAEKWACLDDYVAAYEGGLFENGAVPSGQFIITANGPDLFNEIVDEMQRKHRGSGRNNNVVYTHRPINPTTGNPADAQIEWIPFAQSNKDMSLEAIFEQANKKIDSAFGVPASIRGVNDSNTYASVRVDEQIFIKYAVVPFATKIWARFTHEMNRLTGGLGYAITFDTLVPGVADEEKVEAEKKKIEFELIKDAMKLGFSLDSIIDAFDLSNGYKILKQGYTEPIIVNDKPEVDEGDEVDEAPDSEGKQKNLSVSPKKIESGALCSCGHSHKSVAESPEVVDEIAEVVRKYMNRQIEHAIEGNELTKDINDANEEDITAMVTEILAIITAYMLIKGSVSYAEGIALLEGAGVAITNTTEFIVSEITKSSYRAYLTNVARSFSTDTANAVRNILAQAQVEEWSKEKIATSLRDIMNTDEWRVQRLARTEEHRSFNQSSVDAMKQLMNETGTEIYKVWEHGGSDTPCEFCAAMEGNKVLVNELFLEYGGVVEGVDGGTFQNMFVDVDAGGLHPNCHCRQYYEIKK